MEIRHLEDLIQCSTFVKKYDSEREGWLLLIIILDGVHVRTQWDPASDYLHCARALRLHNVFPPLPRRYVFSKRKTTFKHDVNAAGIPSVAAADQHCVFAGRNDVNGLCETVVSHC